MRSNQAIFLVILALVIGYVAGYYTYVVRFPLRDIRFGSGAKVGNATPPPFVPPLVSDVEKARKLCDQGKTADAQKLLADELRLYPHGPETDSARELLGEINTQLFFASDNLYGKTEYTVQPHDSLARIAQKLKSTPDMIMRANSLNSTVIRPGERLLVPDTQFSLTVNLPEQRVVVDHGGAFFKQYPIQSESLPKSSQSEVATKVTDTTLWKDGKRVSPKGAALDGATPWVNLERSAYVLYGVSGNDGPAGRNRQHDVSGANAAAAAPPPNPDQPPHGIALFKDDLSELQLLLSRGTPVTIIRRHK